MTGWHSKHRTEAAQTGELSQESAWSAYPYKVTRDGSFASRVSHPVPVCAKGPSWIPRLRVMVLCILAAASTAMIMGFLGHSRVAEPFERELLATQSGRLAGAVDAIIGSRAAAVKMAAGSLEIENLSASGGLDRLLGNLRELFPDFISLEVVNDQGQTVAMMGDVALSVMKEKAAPAQWSRGLEDQAAPVFLDDAARGCLLLMMRHVGPDGGQWYSRTRFSRERLSEVLESLGPSWPAKLVASSGSRPQGVASVSGSSTARATLSSEVPLIISGWAVRVEHSAGWLPFHSSAVSVPGVMIVAAVLMYLITVFANRRRREPEEQRAAEAVPSEPLPVGPEWVPEHPVIASEPIAPSQASASVEDRPFGRGFEDEPLQATVETDGMMDEEMLWDGSPAAEITSSYEEPWEDSWEDRREHPWHTAKEPPHMPLLEAAAVAEREYMAEDPLDRERANEEPDDLRAGGAEANLRASVDPEALPEVIEFAWVEPREITQQAAAVGDRETKVSLDKSPPDQAWEECLEVSWTESRPGESKVGPLPEDDEIPDSVSWGRYPRA